MKLIVGLGNPGKQYEKTRHNAGWMVLNEIIKKYGLQESWSVDKKAKAEFLKLQINNQEVELLRPVDFMNNSGFSVHYAVKKNNLKPADIIVVHDDKDINLGEVKAQFDKNSAGHNGVQSIIDHLNNQSFYRIRIGISKPLDNIPIEDYVLQPFNPEESAIINSIIPKIFEEINNI